MGKKEKKQKPLEQVLMESCNKFRPNMSGITICISSWDWCF